MYLASCMYIPVHSQLCVYVVARLYWHAVGYDLSSKFETNMTKPDIDDPDNMEERNEMASSKPGRSSSRLRRVQSSGGKRGRRPSRVDRDAKLERSRQSARECRARKKQKYQLLEETVSEKEKQIIGLREKLEEYKNFCQLMDSGEIPVDIHHILQADDALAVKEAEAAMRPSTSKNSSHRPSLATGVDSSSDEDSD